MAIFLAFFLIFSVNAKKCQDHLAEEFRSLPQWLTQEPSPQKGLPKACVQNAMNAFRGWAQSLGNDPQRNEGTFIFCSEEGIKKSPLPQCQTPAYLNTTVNTYNTITDCLGIDVEDLYPIIASESGFYHNSLSHIEKDFGFGQITSPVIGDVNNTWYTHLDELKKSPKKSCQQILSFLNEYNILPVEDHFSCNLTKAPHNPFLNALYTGFHYKMIQGYTEKFSRETYLQSKIETLLGENFTLETLERVKSIMTILSYNMGHIGMTSAMEEFLEQQLAFLSQFQKERLAISKEIAKINFELRGQNTSTLMREKERLKEKLREQDKKITWLRSPQRFNGDHTPYSFGEFLSQRNLSHYLKVLTRRVEYLSRYDRNKKCPTIDFLHAL